MASQVTVCTAAGSRLGREVIRRLRLKSDDQVVIVEGADFVLVKRAAAESPADRFDALSAKAAERLREEGLSPEVAEDAVRWARGSS